MKVNWTARIFTLVALILAYMRTAEAMVQFAPRSFLGWTDPIVPVLWGYICAGLVEGVALMAIGNLIRITKDVPTRTVSVIVAVISVAFSFAMNILDLRINDGSFKASGDLPIVGFLYTLMALIPIIVAIMFGIMQIVDAYFPDRSGGGGKQKGGGGWDMMPQREPHQMQRQPSLPEPQHRPQGQPGNHNGNGRQPARAFEENLDKFPRLVEADNGDAGKHPTPPRA